MYVYAREQHMVRLFYRTNEWMFSKHRREEVLTALHMRLGFLARSAQGWIQDGATIGQ